MSNSIQEAANRKRLSQSNTMSDNEKKIIQVSRTVWKNNGEFATMDEVIAAKAAVKAMLPELTGSDRGRAIDLLDGLTRYIGFLEDGMFLDSANQKRDIKSNRHAGKRKSS